MARSRNTPSDLKIENKLGEGRKSQVFRAVRRVWSGLPQQEVAVKFFKDQDEFRLFESKFQDLIRLRSPYCASVLGWELVDGRPAILMDRVDGITLEQIFRAGGLSEPQANAILFQVQEGLQDIHQAGLIHGDLSPSNILVTKDGAVRIIDFGLIPKVESGIVVGTPAFLSPERWAGQTPQASDDWFALGLIWRAAIGGERYWELSTEQSRIRAHESVGLHSHWLIDEPLLRGPQESASFEPGIRSEISELVKTLDSEVHERAETIVVQIRQKGRKRSSSWIRFVAAMALSVLVPAQLPKGVFAQGQTVEPPVQGELRIVAQEWAEVLINGRTYGFVPLRIPRLPPGPIAIEMRGPRGSQTVKFDMKLGERILVTSKSSGEAPEVTTLQSE